jgi:hypothetical protein
VCEGSEFLVPIIYNLIFIYQASVKNFQLIRESQPDVVIMQFGKLSEEKFILDFRYSFPFKGTVSREEVESFLTLPSFTLTGSSVTILIASGVSTSAVLEF